MLYNFDELPDRKASESAKWHYFDEDVLPMWVADMDFVSPEPVVRALQERAAHGVFGYPGTPPGLDQAVMAWLERHFNWQVTPEDLTYISGVVTGVNMAGSAFTGPDSGLLIQTPVYMPFLTLARNAGAQAQSMALTYHPQHGYCIDWDAFENAITEQTRLFVLCNPHNPIGRVFTRPELERMAEICLRHNVLICSDEIHCDLVYSGHTHISMASLDPEVARRTITLMAPSKTFNIAGLAASVAIIQDPELRKQFRAAGRGLTHGVNLFGLVAMRAAYGEGQDWLDQLLPYLEANRDWLAGFVKDQLPGISMLPTQGTYLAWLDCRQAGLGSSPGKFFLERARVAVTEGSAFGPGGEGFVRLNFGCPRPMLQEALKRMHTALQAG
jgi:cysteine-S-conjugate beta-lyase